MLAFRVSASNFEFVNSDVPARVERTRAELEALPGIESAAVAFQAPGVTTPGQLDFQLAEDAGDDASAMVADFRIVSPSYFQTVGIPVLAGELCRESDAQSGQVMVNRSFAARYFADRSVVGLRLAAERASPPMPPRRIVGIVGDAREAGIALDPLPTVYMCVVTPGATPWYFVRTTGTPAAAAGSVVAKIRELEPTRSVYDLAPLEEHIGESHAENRLRTLLLTAFAATALALTCLGIYGTLSYVVGLRRREVGLRVAVGARSKDIVAQFLLRALRVVALAGIAGIALALGFGRALSGMLFGVSPSDPATLAGVVGIVAAVAVLAALVPALRAARVDPMQALREE